MHDGAVACGMRNLVQDGIVDCHRVDPHDWTLCYLLHTVHTSIVEYRAALGRIRGIDALAVGTMQATAQVEGIGFVVSRWIDTFFGRQQVIDFLPCVTLYQGFMCLFVAPFSMHQYAEIHLVGKQVFDPIYIPALWRDVGEIVSHFGE